jgi:hypothetical protein
MKQFRIFRTLGMSFRIWLKNFIPFTLFAAMLYSPVWVELASDDKLDPFLLAPLRGVPVYGMLAFSALLTPLITGRVIQDLSGHRGSFITSLRFSVRGILPAQFLVVAMIVLGFVPMMGAIIGMVIMCICFVVTPAAVAERLGPIAAFSRSAHLTQARFWAVFGLRVLVFLPAGVLGVMRTIPLWNYEGTGFTSDASYAAMAEQARVLTIVFLIALGVVQVFTRIVEAVAYVLLREDKEGRIPIIPEARVLALPAAPAASPE